MTALRPSTSEHTRVICEIGEHQLLNQARQTTDSWAHGLSREAYTDFLSPGLPVLLRRA